MKIIAWALGSLIAAFFLHWIVWKIKIPARQAKSMLQIFFGTLALVLAGLGIAAAAGPSSPWLLDSWTEYLQIAFLFTAFTLAYLISYPALEADSPSVVIMLEISRAGSEGLAMESFHQSMTDDVLVAPRLKDLLMDKMAYMEEDRYRLTKKGIWMARVFGCYRKLIDAPKGG